VQKQSCGGEGQLLWRHAVTARELIEVATHLELPVSRKQTIGSKDDPVPCAGAAVWSCSFSASPFYMQVRCCVMGNRAETCSLGSSEEGMEGSSRATQKQARRGQGWGGGRGTEARAGACPFSLP
jgi:hypothetical protein